MADYPKGASASPPPTKPGWRDAPLAGQERQIGGGNDAQAITVRGPGGVVVRFPAGTPKAAIDKAMREVTGAGSGDGGRWQDVPVESGPVYRNPEPSWVPKVNEMQALAYGLGQGASANFLDEGAALRAGLPGSPEYDAELNRQRAFLHGAQEQHPGFYGAGNVVGSVPAALIPAGRAVTTGGKALVSAAEGALQGGLWGFGAGEGTDDRIQQAAEGAGIAGIIGGAIPVAGGIGGAVMNKIGRGRRPAPGSLPPGEAKAISREFDVPLTTGQVTGDPRQLARENKLRSSSRWPGATMEKFDTQQNEALRGAAESIGKRTARGIEAQSAADAGDVVIGGVRGRADALRQQSKAKFREAERGGITFTPEAVRGASEDISRRLADSNYAIYPDAHPVAAAAFRDIQGLADIKPAAGANLDPHSLAAIEKVRSRVFGMRGTNPSDNDALRHLRDAFDGWLDDSIDNSLMAGEPGALDSLKNARKLWRDYKAITTGRADQRGIDDASAKIASFFEKDVTGAEVGSWLTNASALGGGQGGGMAYRTAKKLKSILGPDSDEWGAVRQGVWSTITRGVGDEATKPATAETMANRLIEFLDGNGRALASTLYTPEERAAMRRFASLQKVIGAGRRGSAKRRPAYAEAASDMAWSGIAAGLGFAGAHAGVGVYPMVAVGVGAPIFRNASAISAARRAVSGKTTPPAGMRKTFQTTNRAVTPAITTQPTEEEMRRREALRKGTTP